MEIAITLEQFGTPEFIADPYPAYRQFREAAEEAPDLCPNGAIALSARRRTLTLISQAVTVSPPASSLRPVSIPLLALTGHLGSTLRLESILRLESTLRLESILRLELMRHPALIRRLASMA